MNEKNNQNSFENFFHDKAKEYNIPFNEADWLNLERKLDVREAQIAYRNKVRWIAAAAILIISLLGYFTYENHNRLNQLSQQLDSDASQPVIQSPVISPFPPENDSQTESDEAQDGQYAEDRTDQTEETNDILSLPITNNREDDSGTLQQDAIEGAGEFQSDSEITSDQQLSTHAFDETTLAKISPVFLTDLEFYTPKAIVTSSEVEKTDQRPGSFPQLAFAKSDRDLQNQFSIGFAAGPDMSSVGAFNSSQEPGYKIGVMLEYNISSNLSVSTGTVHSTVRYSTRSQSYNPPTYWTQGVAPDEMIGECLLIDIPIIMKYNFLNLKNSRFFASAGLSSYIMLNEEYHFKYDGYNSELNQYWSSRTGTRHWMSNASFSLGYELDLHPNWSLRAEPFIKTPLREVGWSNVKLFSAGSLVSLNYRL